MDVNVSNMYYSLHYNSSLQIHCRVNSHRGIVMPQIVAYMDAEGSRICRSNMQLTRNGVVYHVNTEAILTIEDFLKNLSSASRT